MMIRKAEVRLAPPWLPISIACLVLLPVSACSYCMWATLAPRARIIVENDTRYELHKLRVTVNERLFTLQKLGPGGRFEVPEEFQEDGLDIRAVAIVKDSQYVVSNFFVGDPLMGYTLIRIQMDPTPRWQLLRGLPKEDD